MTVNTYKQLHPSLQLLIFISITLTGIFIGYLIGAGLIIAFYGINVLASVARLDLSTPNAADALWVLQIISTTVPIFAAALIFARFIVKDPREYLKTTFKFPPVLLAIIFCIMLFSSPLIELLSNINQQLALPQFLGGLQKWMRDSEDKAQKLTEVLLQMKTFWSMVIKVLVVGLLTAVVEEFMFRGCLQTLFARWTKNIHAAVWITAILFSSFHMEFFGFLPRMMLGVLFGYLVAWSGSIWTSVWAHFINNGTAVVLSYLFQNKMIKLNPDDQHVFNYGSYAFSLIIILFLLSLYKNAATGKKLLPEY